MLTDELINLIEFVDHFINSSNNLSDLISRTTAFINVLITSGNNIKNAFAWLFFFIPKSYFEPLITIFLLVMLIKCVMAFINLVYP